MLLGSVHRNTGMGYFATQGPIENNGGPIPPAVQGKSMAHTPVSKRREFVFEFLHNRIVFSHMQTIFSCIQITIRCHCVGCVQVGFYKFSGSFYFEKFNSVTPMCHTKRKACMVVVWDDFFLTHLYLHLMHLYFVYVIILVDAIIATQSVRIVFC